MVIGDHTCLATARRVVSSHQPEAAVSSDHLLISLHVNKLCEEVSKFTR